MNWCKRLFTRENGIALLLALLVAGLIVFTVSEAPQWIYQGF